MKELFKFCGRIPAKVESIAGIVGALILIVVWYLISTYSGVSDKILPSPAAVISCIPELISDYGLFGNIGYTVGLNLTGYFYAIIIAVPLGFAIGLFPVMRALFQKPIEAIRFLPIPAASGLFIATFGLTYTMKSSFLAFGILIFLLPVIVHASLELQDPNNVKENVYLQTAKTIGMNKFQMFRYVIFPFVMAKFYTNLRELTAISYTYIVIAETLFKDHGIGASISTMGRIGRWDCVYALLFIIIIIGIVQDFLFRAFEPVIFKYKKG